MFRDSQQLIRLALSAAAGLGVLLLPLSRATSRESGPPASKPPNVVLLTIDALRADHLRCYGYTAIETPHIDALARAGARFTHAYTPVPITLPAHASLLTGTFPMAAGMHDFTTNKLPANSVTLAKVLRDNGYTTAAFIGSTVLDSRFGVNQGFDTYYDHFDFRELRGSNFDEMERRGDVVVDEALSWLKLNPRQPFFLWVHLYDPHHPYTPPEPFASRYRTLPYDGEIAFADAQVGRLSAYLQERGFYEKALIVLASDHGEGLGEHGEQTHGFFIYNSTLHVRNLLAGRGARVHEMRERFYGLMRRYTPAAGPEPEKVLTDPALYERPRALGYVAVSAGTFAQASGKPLPDPKDRIQTYELVSEAMADGQRGQYQESLRKLAEASKAEPDSPTINYMMDLNYQSLRDLPKALEHFRAALKVNPDFSLALYYLGVTQAETGDLDGAAGSLARAIELDPTNFSAAFELGIVHLKKRHYDEAFREFQRTVALNPDFAPAHAAVGEGYLRQGKPNEAAKELERAVELDPRSRRARHSLGLAYQALGRTADAQKEFERAKAP